MEDELKERIEAGRSVVTAQVDLLHREFGRAKSHWKHDGTRVTPIDLEITERVFTGLEMVFPDDDFFSEEGDPDTGPIEARARFAWMLDPVDGTNNYALGVPMVAISLALLVDGEPVYGFIYDFGARRLYHGGPGRGLWQDDEPIERRAPGETKEPIIALHSPIDEKHLPLVLAILRGHKIRAHGSGALHLTNVALGRIDGCLDYTIKTWDIAAATALCRESGIELIFFEQSPFPVRSFDVRMKPIPYMAARPDLMQDLKERLPRP